MVPVKKKVSKPLTTVTCRGVLLVPQTAKAHARVVRVTLADEFNEVALPGQMGGRAGMTPEFAAQSSRRERAGADLHIDLSAAFCRYLNELVLGLLTSRENRHAFGVSMGWDPAMIEECQDRVQNPVVEMRGQDDPRGALAADWNRGRRFQVRHARKHAALMAGVDPGEPLADLTFN